jgi:hypothetical protein
VVTATWREEHAEGAGITVYNLTVEGGHTYSVDDQSPGGAVWVHNTCEPYQVARYNVLKRLSNSHDGLAIHHAGQQHWMKKLIANYNPHTGPAIAVPTRKHWILPNVRGPLPTGATPRSMLAQDIRNLRKLTDASNGSLKELIALNKLMYPRSFAR